MLTFSQDTKHNSLLAHFTQPENDKPLTKKSAQRVLELQSFETCRNSCHGPVIIVASGPSAASFPLEKYRHIPMIAMNGSLLRLQQDNIKPIFYLCDDPRFVKNRTQVVVDAAATASNIGLNGPSLDKLLQLQPDCAFNAHHYLMERVNRSWQHKSVSDLRYAWSIRHDTELLSDFSLLRRKPNRIGFSTNLTKGYFSARTIPYAALQIACHMGFNQAFLVGLDLNPALGRCYAESDRVLKSTLDIDYDDFILPSFTFMQERIQQAVNFSVYNLSIDSRLPDTVVPKLTLPAFDALLSTQASNK